MRRIRDLWYTLVHTGTGTQREDPEELPDVVSVASKRICRPGFIHDGTVFAHDFQTLVEQEYITQLYELVVVVLEVESVGDNPGSSSSNNLLSIHVA